MNSNRTKAALQNTALILTSLAFSFISIEIGFRLFDPTPYSSDAEINNTDHGNLSMFHETLGWQGLPNGDQSFVTRNNRVRVTHNSLGFRDTEHNPATDDKPAIVFLGDSFTWGFEVEFEEMFANRLRDKFSDYEIFNLAHPGYGTDQSYLTFKQWTGIQPLALVVLMFSENDNSDNNAIVNYRKSKPKFERHGDALVLTGVPVPSSDSWSESPSPEMESDQESFREALKMFFYSSHFINNMRIRYKLYRMRNEVKREPGSLVEGPVLNPDYTLTGRILEELNTEVMRRGSRLVMVFIPSKREIDQLDDSKPYQTEMAALCDTLGITYFDLAPSLKDTFSRTYYRQGMHWNPHGHEVAATAMQDFLQQQLTP